MVLAPNQTLEHFSIETHGDLGIHLKNPPVGFLIQTQHDLTTLMP